MSKQEMTPFNLPEVISFEIFSRLSIKSLGICMCVSKVWYVLIKSPDFVSFHLDYQSKNSSCNNNKNLFLMMSSYYGKESKVEYFLHFADQEFRVHTHLQCTPLDSYHYVVGSCNGLLCLLDFQFSFASKFILCNPIIKKSIRLPKPYFYSLQYKISVGFGFDSIRNDYKVLKITKKDVLEKYVDVELYSLNRNSWKILAPPKYDLYSDDFMVFVNGVVHWVAYERVKNGHRCSRCKFLLLGFDMGIDVFKEIMLPESLSNMHERSEMHVMPYGELSSIAMIELVSLYECNIWVMTKYGMVETWTKTFSFGFIGTGLMPRVLGFWQNNILVMKIYNDPHELERNEIKKLGIHQGIYAFVLSYMESLVLIDRVIDARNENGAKYVSNARNSIEGEAGDFTELAAGEEAIDDSSDAEDCTSSALS